MGTPNLKRTKNHRGIFLLSIGDELLDGRTQNTNASWFGEQLRLLGIPVSEIRCVSDKVSDIVAAFQDGLKFRAVVTTGGLGPTNDDRTLEAAGLAFQRKLKPTKASLEHVRKRYAARNLPLTEPRLRLAQIPERSKIFQNPSGTAPGVHLSTKQTEFFFLPGPPTECRPIFTKDVLPKLKKLNLGKSLLKREFWRTFGRGESEIYQRLAGVVRDLEQRYSNTFSFGVHISFPCIDLTMEIWKVKGEKTPTQKEIKNAKRAIDDALGSLCFTRKRETLVEVVSRLLRERDLTLTTAESCTGGLLAKMLTDLPGSSDVYIGGVVSYANSAKVALLDVNTDYLENHGAVSEAVVKEMAENVRERLQSDYALALSGVAGPGGGSKDKPVGTVYISLSSDKGSKILHQVILGGRGSRDQNRIIAAHLALDALRSEILGSHGSGIPVN